MKLVALVLAWLCLACAGATAAHARMTAGGSGTASAEVDTLADGAQPTATAALTIVTVTWGQTSFRGTPVGSLAGGGYTIKRYPLAGGAAVTPTGSCANTVTGSTATLSCQDTVLQPGNWKYTVTPILNSWTGGESPFSGSAPVAPSAPLQSAIVRTDPPAGQTVGGMSLSWSAVTGATGYNVYRRTSAGSFNYSAPLNGATPVTGTTYADPGTGLTAGTTYAYVIRAVANTLTSVSSNERTATPVVRPAPPASVTATAGASGRIDVAWPAVTDATGYNVYRRDSPLGTFGATPVNGAVLVTGTTFADTTAVAGTSYVYMVRAVGTSASGGRLESADSTESNVGTPDTTAPTGTLATVATSLRASPTLTATASDTGSGVANVRFQISPAGAATWTDLCTDASAPYACTFDTTTRAEGLYDFRIVTTDNAGNTANSASQTSRRIDNTVPTGVTLGTVAARIGATVTLTATASDSGSGVASVAFQRAPTGTSTWTTICTDTAAAYSCAFNTTTVTAGGYDLRAVATDRAGNQAISAIQANRVVDNVKPTGTTTFGANVGNGTPGAGDVVTYTYSEAIAPASLIAGWAGTAITVQARITNNTTNDRLYVYQSNGTTLVPLGYIATARNFVTGTVNFTNSTLTLNGATATLTLGTPSGTVTARANAANMSWVVATGATDLVGNTATAATHVEGGASDVDF